jgi:hypothetical protein
MYECRAILGSREVFSDPRFSIPVFSTEWNYVEGPGRYSSMCPLEKMQELVTFITALGYKPFEYSSGKPLNSRTFFTWWKGTHVVWRK